MGKQLGREVVRKDIELKHEKMRESPFVFLRATYWRWAETILEVCPDLATAAPVLGVGDIHLENFGTWRDADGRLVWGVNDFDEAAELPFTSDLVRLATSAQLEIERQKDKDMKPVLSTAAAIAAIAAGYERGLDNSSPPFVLENHYPTLRDLAIVKGKDAVREWEKIREDGEVKAAQLSESLRVILLTGLPSGITDVRFYRRLAGLGGLGRPRYVAVGRWQGGLTAREAKAAAPSAIRMPRTNISNPLHDYRRIEALSIRARDPQLRLVDGWIVRRLSPETRRIEIDTIEDVSDPEALLQAMGRELANVHRGTAGSARPLLEFLDSLPENWLHRAAAKVAELITKEFYAVYGEVEKARSRAAEEEGESELLAWGDEDELEEELPSGFAETERKSLQIFISYRREDEAGFAGRLYDRFVLKFSTKQIFMDVDSIPPGEDFVRLLEIHVDQCKVLLAVIGKG
jgi:hypothetical protein